MKEEDRCHTATRPPAHDANAGFDAPEVQGNAQVEGEWYQYINKLSASTPRTNACCDLEEFAYWSMVKDSAININPTKAVEVPKQQLWRP